MKKPLMLIFGAGNIGRGFIGQIFCQNQYQVVFIDADEELVNLLEEKKFYPIEIVSNDSLETLEIGPIEACLASDRTKINDLLAKADIIATAVGVPVLPFIAEQLAEGLKNRQDLGVDTSIDILVCENKIEAGQYLKKLILGVDNQLGNYLDAKVGFIDTSIGRMVPTLSSEERADNRLLIRSEPYQELPVDAAAFKGPVPTISNIKTFSPFQFYQERKLYIHNMGHAIAAYLGFLGGFATIAQAMENKEINIFVKGAMCQLAQALSQKYDYDYSLIEEYIQDLLERFSNRPLADTVARVGRDPLRKTEKNDRLAGAIRLMLKQGEFPLYTAFALAAALCFDPPGDPSAGQVEMQISDHGLDFFLTNHCGLEDNEKGKKIIKIIKAQYNFIRATRLGYSPL